MLSIPWLKRLRESSDSGDFVSEVLNPHTGSTAARSIQRLLGLSDLDGLYTSALSAQRDSESIFDVLLRILNVTWEISPLDRARIPGSGGAIVVANHPFGLIEGVVMNALLHSVRPDARVLANSLLGRYPEVSRHLILVDPFGGEAATLSNRFALRESLAWIKQGGILGVFPAGEVSSLDLRGKRVIDPPWNKSVARLASLARVPVLPVFFAGRNHMPFQMAGLIHPRFRTALLIREFLNKAGRALSLRVGNLIAQRKLEELATDLERIEYVRRKTYILANRHEPAQPLPFLVALRGKPAQGQPVAQPDIVCATDPVLMLQEISALPPSAFLHEQGENAVYAGHANQLPNVVREIGRLREITFRDAGEGTGRSIDLDEFDSYYLHLFIWNRTNREIVGAYRIAQSDIILRDIGRRGFYTSTLFSYQRRFLERITPALEMGRSFVRREYQKNYTPLLLLWRGIGAFVCRNPQYKILFGPVSISNDYHPGSRQLIVKFLKEYCRADDLARLVRARSPFRIRPLRAWDDQGQTGATWDIEELSALVADIEVDRKGVPVLLRQYLKLGGKLVSFNVDASFSDTLDGLIVIDLLKTDQRLLERYFGTKGAAEFLACHRRPIAVAR